VTHQVRNELKQDRFTGSTSSLWERRVKGIGGKKKSILNILYKEGVGEKKKGKK